MRLEQKPWLRLAGSLATADGVVQGWPRTRLPLTSFTRSASHASPVALPEAGCAGDPGVGLLPTPLALLSLAAPGRSSRDHDQNHTRLKIDDVHMPTDVHCSPCCPSYHRQQLSYPSAYPAASAAANQGGMQAAEKHVLEDAGL